MPEISTLGKYEVRREIGRGAMGVVYEGYDPLIKRLVALKTIRADQLAGEEAGNVIAAAIQRTHEDRSNIRSQAAVESPARRVPSRSKTAIWVEPGVADRSRLVRSQGVASSADSNKCALLRIPHIF